MPSTLSKVNKSKEWKERKRQKHRENQDLRASLHSQKANARDYNARAEIQRRIDAISNNT